MSLSFYLNEENNINESINNYEYIFDEFKKRIPTLNEALIQMFTYNGVDHYKSYNLINEILSKVNSHLNSRKFNEIKINYPKITFEEAQIISTYTCELANPSDKHLNPYKIINQNLVSKNRNKGIQNISKYLFIFLKSLRKLNKFYPKKNNYLYRCIKSKVELNYNFFDKNKIPYINGETKIFWGFSSCSESPNTAFSFLGKKENMKSGTIFSLSGDVWGYDLYLFNVFNEKEILLEPERKILVEESIPPINDIIYVKCKVLNTPIVLKNIILNENYKDNINYLQTKINNIYSSQKIQKSKKKIIKINPSVDCLLKKTNTFFDDNKNNNNIIMIIKMII